MGEHKDHDEQKIEALDGVYGTTPTMDCRSYISMCYAILRSIEDEQSIVSDHARATELEALKTLYRNDLEDCLDWISQMDD